MQYHLCEIPNAKPNGLGIVSEKYYTDAKFKCKVVFTGSLQEILDKKKETK